MSSLDYLKDVARKFITAEIPKITTTEVVKIDDSKIEASTAASIKLIRRPETSLTQMKHTQSREIFPDDGRTAFCVSCGSSKQFKKCPGCGFVIGNKCCHFCCKKCRPPCRVVVCPNPNCGDPTLKPECCENYNHVCCEMESCACCEVFDRATSSNRLYQLTRGMEGRGLEVESHDLQVECFGDRKVCGYRDELICAQKDRKKDCSYLTQFREKMLQSVDKKCVINRCYPHFPAKWPVTQIFPHVALRQIFDVNFLDSDSSQSATTLVDAFADAVKNKREYIPLDIPFSMISESLGFSASPMRMNNGESISKFLQRARDGPAGIQAQLDQFRRDLAQKQHALIVGLDCKITNLPKELLDVMSFDVVFAVSQVPEFQARVDVTPTTVVDDPQMVELRPRGTHSFSTYAGPAKDDHLNVSFTRRVGDHLVSELASNRFHSCVLKMIRNYALMDPKGLIDMLAKDETVKFRDDDAYVDVSEEKEDINFCKTPLAHWVLHNFPAICELNRDSYADNSETFLQDLAAKTLVTVGNGQFVRVNKDNLYANLKEVVQGVYMPQNLLKCQLRLYPTCSMKEAVARLTDNIPNRNSLIFELNGEFLPVRPRMLSAEHIRSAAEYSVKNLADR